METSKNLFNKSVDFLKGKYLAFIFFFFAPFIISLIFVFAEDAAINENFIIPMALVAFITQILLIIIGLTFNIGTLRYVDSKNNNQDIKIVDTLKNNWKLILLFFILGIVNMLIVLTPFLILIIPGVILSFVFQYAMFQLILRNKSLYSSIALSLYLVKGRVWTFIKKALYPIIFRILPLVIAFCALIALAFFVVLRSQSIGTNQILLAVAIGLVSIFLIVIIIRYSFVTYIYNYFLFLELEKTAAPVTEEELQKTKVKLMWATALSPIAAILILFTMFVLVIQ